MHSPPNTFRVKAYFTIDGRYWTQRETSNAYKMLI